MKSIHRPEYQAFCTVLRDLREEAKLRQSDLAAKLGVPQAYVSAYELGKVRQDFVQLRDWCEACGRSLADLVAAFEDRWSIEGPALKDLAAKRADAKERRKAGTSTASKAPATAPPKKSTKKRT